MELVNIEKELKNFGCNTFRFDKIGEVSFRGIKIVITKTHLVTRKRLQKIKHRLAHSQCC